MNSQQIQPRRHRLILAALPMLAAWATAAAQPVGSLEREMSPVFTSCPFPQQPNVSYSRKSIYVPMQDGVRLAIDIFLPKNISQGARLPTLYMATRYWRAHRGAPLQPNEQQWLAQGYAVVNADVRGTGASFGQWHIPYSPHEARDIGYLANWIARQPWSDGKVVMTGNSYSGTTALMAPAYGAPAIKAVAPKFSDFDLYTDLLWPGGVAAEQLDTLWGDLVHKLDLDEMPGGVRPVDGRQGKALLAQAVKGHVRYGFTDVYRDITYKDQRLSRYAGLSMGDAGVYNLQTRIMRSGVPIFGWGSWLDSGIAQGLVNRFMTWSNPQLTIIGPWTHGAAANVDVFNPKGPLDPTVSEQNHLIFCFLNHYARDAKSPNPLSVHKKILIYFTMGEEKWKTTYVWPIPGTQHRKLFFAADQTLAEHRPVAEGRDVYQVDFNASTGPDNRWTTQVGLPGIDYGDRAREDQRLQTYTSSPLRHDWEITGQPVITLRAASNRTDGNFFVYLEDVSPDGKVTYLTEGELRAIDRKLSAGRPPYRTTYPYRSFSEKDAEPLRRGEFASLVFPLEATSVRIRAGDRLRVAIAGADKGFVRVPAQGGARITILRGGPVPSFIELPIVPTPHA